MMTWHFDTGVTQQEKRRGASLLDKPKMMLLQDCGANLCLTLDDLGPGWRIRPGHQYKVRTTLTLLTNELTLPLM